MKHADFYSNACNTDLQMYTNSSVDNCADLVYVFKNNLGCVVWKLHNFILYSYFISFSAIHLYDNLSMSNFPYDDNKWPDIHCCVHARLRCSFKTLYRQSKVKTDRKCCKGSNSWLCKWAVRLKATSTPLHSYFPLWLIPLKKTCFSLF